jgi:hypothetical protein
VTAMYYHVLSHTSATLMHGPSAVVAPRNRQIGLRGPSVLVWLPPSGLLALAMHLKPNLIGQLLGI